MFDILKTFIYFFSKVIFYGPNEKCIHLYGQVYIPNTNYEVFSNLKGMTVWKTDEDCDISDELMG